MASAALNGLEFVTSRKAQTSSARWHVEDLRVTHRSDGSALVWVQLDGWEGYLEIEPGAWRRIREQCSLQ